MRQFTTRVTEAKPTREGVTITTREGDQYEILTGYGTQWRFLHQAPCGAVLRVSDAGSLLTCMVIPDDTVDCAAPTGWHQTSDRMGADGALCRTCGSPEWMHSDELTDQADVTPTAARLARQEQTR